MSNSSMNDASFCEVRSSPATLDAGLSGACCDSRTNCKPDSGSDSDDEDVARLFTGVLSCLRLDRVPDFCAKVRQQYEGVRDDHTYSPARPVVLQRPLFGSYHTLHRIKFEDGRLWLLKVPARGTRLRFNEGDSRALTSEALTMKFLRRETSIPIPEVFAFDASTDNVLCCPFILMEYVPGTSLSNLWHDRSCSRNELQERRTRSLRDIANAMAQLERFSFDSGGSLIYDENENPVSIGPTRLLDHRAELDKMSDDDSDNVGAYMEAGPWANTSSFFKRHIVADEEPTEPFQIGLRKLLLTFLQLVPEPVDPRKGFVLAHPDFDIQNFIVSGDGSLRAIIDWDGVAAVPRSIGYEAYPGWLTRDWDPAMYGWTEHMEQGIEPEGCWEDSPSTLSILRADYERFMQSSLALQREQGIKERAETHEVDMRQRTIPPVSRTANSLYTENLLIAAANPVCTFEILSRFMDEVRKVVNSGPSDDLDIFAVADTLGHGDLDENKATLLKRGFRMLFGLE